MKVFLVARIDGRIGYDEYDSHVVAANTKEEVEAILNEEFKWYGGHGNWWADGNAVAKWSIEEVTNVGIVCSSFNAG